MTSVAIAASKSGCHGASRSVATAAALSSFGTVAAPRRERRPPRRGARRRDGTPTRARSRRRAAPSSARAEQHHRGRGLRADRAVEHPHVAAAGVQADAQEPGVEARRLRRRGARRTRARGSCPRRPRGRSPRRPSAAASAARGGSLRRSSVTDAAFAVGLRAPTSEPSAATSAPEQNAGGFAGDHDRADRRRRLRARRRSSTISATIGAVSALRRSTVDERDERDAVVALDANVFHQARSISRGGPRRGVAEEVFDLALVAVRRVLVADRLRRGAARVRTPRPCPRSCTGSGSRPACSACCRASGRSAAAAAPRAAGPRAAAGAAARPRGS